MWGDLCARARGLATHLLPPEALAEIERTDDPDALAATLARWGYPRELLTDHSLHAVEHAAGARFAADLTLLAKRAGERAEALAVVFEDEDRRSLRALVRGLAAGAPAEDRVAAAIPTPRLSEEALDELARLPSLGELADQLLQRRHPLACAVAEHATGSVIDLFAIELALARKWAQRAHRHHRHGGHALATYTAQVIDVENTATALALAERGEQVDAPACHLPGGWRLSIDRLVEAAAMAPRAAREYLARAYRGTPLAAALLAPEPGALEDAALTWQLTAQRRLRRVEPLGPAPLLWLALQRRREARCIRRAAWRVNLTAAEGASP